MIFGALNVRDTPNEREDLNRAEHLRRGRQQ